MRDRGLVVELSGQLERALKIRAGLGEIAPAPQKAKRDQVLPFSHWVAAYLRYRERVRIVLLGCLEVAQQFKRLAACPIHLQRRLACQAPCRLNCAVELLDRGAWSIQLVRLHARA